MKKGKFIPIIICGIGGVMIGFFANKLNTILGCILFCIGICLLLFSIIKIVNKS